MKKSSWIIHGQKPNHEPTQAPIVASALQAPPASALEVRVLTSYRAVCELESEWDRLYAECGANHPFLAFQWLDCWWQRMQPKGLFQTHRLSVIAIYRDGDLHAVAPLFLTTYLRMFLGGLRYLRPIGSDRNLTELKCLLIKPGFEETAVSCLAKHLWDQRHQHDLVRWLDLPKAQVEACGLHLPKLTEAFILPLETSWEELKGGLKRNIKESIRKSYNAPARAGVELRFETVTDRHEILRLLPEFYRLHAKRARSSQGPTHRDYFERRQHREFLEELVTKLGAVRPLLFVVRHGDQIVGARIAFLANSTLYLYFSGYEPEYGAYNVMTRVLVEAIQYAHHSGVRTINLSTGRDASKLRWSPRSVAYVSGVRWSSTLRARFLGMLARPLAASKARIDRR